MTDSISFAEGEVEFSSQFLVMELFSEKINIHLKSTEIKKQRQTFSEKKNK